MAFKPRPGAALNRRILDDAERRVRNLPEAPVAPARKMQETSGTERDLRELEEGK